MILPSESTNGDWDNEDEESGGNWDEGSDLSEPFGSKVCHECGAGTIGEECGFCGNDLCPSCFGMGAGFCSERHTQEQIDDYEDRLMGPPDEAKIKARKARNELQVLGILPKP